MEQLLQFIRSPLHLSSNRICLTRSVRPSTLYPGVSIAMCLAFISSARTPTANCGTATVLTHLQSDIERYLFSFPTIFTGTFRDLALQGDPRALVVLLHFYHSTQILLRGDQGWWARDRCRVMQSLIWKHLNAKGLDVYAHVPGWSDMTASTVMIK